MIAAEIATLRMSLKAHPMALLRHEFKALGYVKAKELATLPLDRIVNVAGIVLIRQRPGIASGVIFSTLGDETGIANLIVWPGWRPPHVEKAAGILDMVRMVGAIAGKAEGGIRLAEQLSSGLDAIRY